jgi:hypothetical protein
MDTLPTIKMKRIFERCLLVQVVDIILGFAYLHKIFTRS